VKYLVDTNVISEVRKGPRCDQSVAAWWSSVAPEGIFLSVLTIGEIRKGVENIRRRDARSASVLETWLLRIISHYRDQILPIELDIVEEWGWMSVPNPLPVIDGLIAATAKVRGLTLVTRNIADMERAGVSLLNPWQA
jgi:predicted nucleic acid-binding protein